MQTVKPDINEVHTARWEGIVFAGVCSHFGGGGVTYLGRGEGERVPTLDRGEGRGYLSTYPGQGEEVHTLDRGRGYLPWMERGYLAFAGRGTYLGWGEGRGYLPWIGGKEGVPKYLPWTGGGGYIPWTGEGVPTLDGRGVPSF